MGNSIPIYRSIPALICAITGVKLLLLIISPVELAPDEAYYWDWSRNLDWAYFSKGSTIALLIAASTAIFGDTAFAVRLPTTLCSGLFLWGLWRCLQRCAAPTTPQATLVILFCSSIFFCTLGLGATTDAPCLAALVWSMYYCMQNAPVRCGLLMGLAVTTKYTACLFALAPVLTWMTAAMHTSTTKDAVPSVLRYATVVACCLTPILYWNLAHANINFQHNAGHLLPHSWGAIRWFSGTIELILTQVTAIGVMLLPFLVGTIRRNIRSSPASQAQRSAYWFGISALLVLAVCIIVSIYRRIYPNWPMPLYPFLLLMAATVAENFSNQNRLRKYARASWIITGILLTLAMPVLLGFPLPGAIRQAKPLQKITGWQALGKAIDQHTGNSSFIYASHYELAAESAFYSQKKLLAICDTLDNRRMNQYDVWRNRWKTVAGENAIIVIPSELIKAPRLQQQFAKVELLATVSAGGKELSLLRGERFNNLP